VSITLKEARQIASELYGQQRGWTASGYCDSLKTSKFLQVTGDTVSIDWERVEKFAQEVAAIAVMQYVNEYLVDRKAA
jgi:hypothetical protein